jgi:hypothetical protein
LFKVVAAAALVAATVVPAASAKTAAVKLSVLPLPKTALGTVAKSLPLEHDSGVFSNADAAGHALQGATASTFAKMGRISGYSLDYGIGPSGGSGVTEVWTSVDQYKTNAGAKKGLAFWKKDDPLIANLNQGGFAVTNTAVSVPAVGGGRFAFFASYSASNIARLYSIDEQFTEGRYEADVTVWSGTSVGLKGLTTKLAKALDRRIKQALAGKLKAKPVKLPAKPQAGPPRGGPDLAPLALNTTDLNGTATVNSQGYGVDPLALSDFSVFMDPAGPFTLLDQESEWFATANQAAFEADFATAQALGGGATPLDLTGVGDGAQGVIENGSGAGAGQIVFSSGHLGEFIVAIGTTTVQTSDLQSVAEKAAGYINNAGLGS